MSVKPPSLGGNRGWKQSSRKNQPRNSFASGLRRTVCPWRKIGGKAAENLRRIAPYMQARTVLVSLHPALRQVCLNVLQDRKRLILPTPGLQKGFVLLDPAAIPPPKRHLAIRFKWKESSLSKIPYDKPLVEPIDMIVAESLAVTPDGKRIGDGRGFLDLQAAIVQILGWAHPAMQIVSLVQEDSIVESLPVEETDVGADWIVTPRRAWETSRPAPAARRIVWEKLDAKAIRRNDALYNLHRKIMPGALPRGGDGGGAGKKDLIYSFRLSIVSEFYPVGCYLWNERK